ncbi:hypothetical protein NL676_012747 [Syzygium grande]|nr:hypothetical protein NL676_012747 [Syzygium grande]
MRRRGNRRAAKATNDERQSTTSGGEARQVAKAASDEWRRKCGERPTRSVGAAQRCTPCGTTGSHEGRPGPPRGTSTHPTASTFHVQRTEENGGISTTTATTQWSKAEEKFSDYFEKWVCRLEEYCHQLHSASRETSITEQELRALVSKLTAHHKEYYTAKWAAAAAAVGGGSDDFFAFFSPPWSSPLENSYSWLTGWKPSTAFRVLEALRAQGGHLRDGGPDEEVGVAERRMVELARLAGRRGEAAVTAAAGGQVDVLVDAAIKGLASGLERIMKAADCVRLKTLKGVLDELSPAQSVEFLAAISALQVQLRRWGKRRQSQVEHRSKETC